MSYITYTPRKFGADSMAIIEQANSIIADYRRQGYSLTLRQLYYQFVARDLIPNSDKSYKRLGDVISSARLAGEISWSAIEDRTRNLQELSHWQSPSSIIAACADQIRVDLWSDQPYRVEVWVEKEALAGVVARVAQQNDVPYLACRGYMSQSEMWAAGQRFIEYNESEQDVIILHLGDHDPSGIDMTRDIEDRLNLFVYNQGYNSHHNESGMPIEIRRLALNHDQVLEHNPPPNPAKITDSRAAQYIKQHGRYSWELDALQPQLINDLIQQEIDSICDKDLYSKQKELQQSWREGLKKLSDNWSDYASQLGINGGTS